MVNNFLSKKDLSCKINEEIAFRLDPFLISITFSVLIDVLNKNENKKNNINNKKMKKINNFFLIR